MRRNIALVFLSLAPVALSACVSSSDFEHLERQDQLHQMETANFKKRLDAVTHDLETQRASTAAVEAELAAAKQSLAEKTAAADAMEAAMAAKTLEVESVTRKLGKVREALNGNSLARAATRKALLLELLPPVSAAPVTTPENAPAANQADEGVTH